MSVSRRSKSPAEILSSASAPFDAVVTLWPSCVSARASNSRIGASSSAMMMRATAIPALAAGKVPSRHKPHQHLFSAGRGGGETAAEGNLFVLRECWARQERRPGIELLTAIAEHCKPEAWHLDRALGDVHDVALDDQDRDAILQFARRAH